MGSNDEKGLSVIPNFPEDDFAWLSAEAQRRGLEIYQFIDELIRTYMPQGFFLKGTEAEASELLAKQLRTLVRSVRRAVV